MPATFSASTCISLTNASNGPFDIYLNSDYTSTPFSSATLVQLTTCPYVIVVPTGTTSLGFKDTDDYFCFETIIQNNDICSNCNLELSDYSATTITRLSCGFLLGSCQNITDYVIHWYGPNDTTTLQKRTGFGSVFSGEYDITHPFLGNASIPLPEGDYTPIIQKVIVSGLTFSNTGGTNTILFDGNCLPTTTIQPLTCLNRTNTKPQYWASGYSHNITFSSESQGTPQPVSSTYLLSPTTNFIAWKFQGKQNSDTIKLSFRGSGYVDDIGLENWVIGTNSTAAYTPSLISKSASTPSYFTKITCLTGLTRNPGDKIIIDIIPADNNTDWDLLITCLDNFNCVSCSYTNPYKIIGSTITGITGDCQTYVKFSLSACSLNTLYSEDYFKYYDATNNGGGIVFFQRFDNIWSPQLGTFNIIFNSNSPQLQYNSNPLFYYNTYDCTSLNYQIVSVPICKEDPNDVTYRKTFLTDGSGRGVFGVTGSSTVISTHYNSWINALNFSNAYGGNSADNTNLAYYRYFTFYFPKPIHPLACGDQSGVASVLIHPTSIVSTGTTSTGNYFFNITANTITKGLNFSTCDINCISKTDSPINNVNPSSTGASAFNQYFSANTSLGNYGIYYSNPFGQLWWMTATTRTISAQTIGYKVETNEWTTNTYPYSGTSPSIIPSLSGSVCNFNNLGVKSGVYNGSFYNSSTLCYYTILYPNSADTRSFEIWAAPIVNYSANTNFNNAILAYRYSGGTVTTSNPTYII